MPVEESREGAIALLSDLLPNEHILNFYEGIPVLPAWLTHPFNLVLGSGDGMSPGRVTNIEYHSAYNIFACLPWSSDDSLRQNVQYLLTHQKHKKILCFLDMQNETHVKRFVQVFQESIDYIGYDIIPTGLPRFPYEVVGELLSDTGIATFVFPPVSSQIPLRLILPKLIERPETVNLSTFSKNNVRLALSSNPTDSESRVLKNEAIVQLLPHYMFYYEKLKESVIQHLAFNRGLLFNPDEFSSELAQKSAWEKHSLFINLFSEVLNFYKISPYYMKTKTDGNNYKISWLRPSIQSYIDLTSGLRRYKMIYKKTIYSFNLPEILEKAKKKEENGIDVADMKWVQQYLTNRIVALFKNDKIMTEPIMGFWLLSRFFSILEKLQASSGGKRKKRRNTRRYRKQSRRYTK